MTHQASIKALINQFAGQYNTLTIQRPYIEFCGGSIEGGLFLSQLLYWSDRVQDSSGWFYKSYKEWRSEIYIPEKKIREWSKRFGDFLETVTKRAPNGNPTIHYRLDWEAFTTKFMSFLQGSIPPVPPFTPNGRNETASSPERNGQMDLTETAKWPERNGEFAGTIRSDGRNNQYTSTTTSISSSTTSSSTTKSARAENFEGEVFEAEFWDEQEEFNPVNSQEFLGTEIDRDYRTEIKNVPGAAGCGAETSVAGLAKIQPVDTFAKRFGCTSKVDPNYDRFKRDYRQFCCLVNANYGNQSNAEQAWSIAMADGFPPEFWDGLAAYIDWKVCQFRTEGKAIGVKGAANWLLDREWETALERKQMLDKAAAHGVNMADPKAVKQAQKEADRQTRSAQYLEHLKAKFGRAS